MKRILSILAILITLQSNIFSQNILVYDHLNKTNYEIVAPDTLYVVYGREYEDGDYSYVDYRDFVGFDIFFIEKPLSSQVFLSEYESWENRIVLSYCKEVFYDEYYTENIDIQNLEFYLLYETSKISKFGFRVSNLKKIVLIPYNVEGEKITETEYFNLKNGLKNVLKLFNFNKEKKD